MPYNYFRFSFPVRLTIRHRIRQTNRTLSCSGKEAALKYPTMIAILCCIPPALAQQPVAPSGSPEQIQRDLVQIEREIGRANLECDYKYFDKVEAEEVLFTDSAGGLTTKKEDMAGEKDCHKSHSTYDLDETRVQLYSGTAVVTGRVTTTGTSKEGQQVVHRSRFTDVFVWRDARWQVVAGHSSAIPEAKTP
jgi:hypothetical protein